MHTSDLFHKQPWSDGPVNLYDQLGVDYYENKYRWVLGGDTSGGDGDDGATYDEPQGPQAYTAEAAQKGGYSTAEEAMGFFGNLTGARGTDQEYADARAAQAALESGLPTFVDTRGITQNLRDGMPEQPGDYLSDAIAEFNRNPSIAINPVNLLTLPLKTNPVTLLGGAAASIAARKAGVPDLVKVSAKGGVELPMVQALKDQFIKDDGYSLPEGTTIMPIDYADGGPIVPQGGIASLAYYDDGGPVEGGRGTPYERKEIEDLTKTYRSDGRGGMYEVDPNEELMMEDVPVPRRLKDTVSQIIYALEMMQRVPYDRRPYDENINLTAPYRYFGGKDQRPADPQPYEMMPKELNGR